MTKSNSSTSPFQSRDIGRLDRYSTQQISELRKQLAATNRRVDQHQEFVEYVKQQRDLERYRARREQMLDQAGILSRWKWKLTGVPVDDGEE